MAIIRVSLVAIVLSLLLSGCNKSEKIIISGLYNGDRDEYIKITRIDVDTHIFIDSVKINRSGVFKIGFSNTMPAFYNLGFDNSENITVIAYPGDRINLIFNGELLQDNYEVIGSKESEDIRQMDIRLSKTLSTLDSLSNIYTSISEGDESEIRRKELEDYYESAIKDQRMYNIAYIIQNLNSFASIKALFQRLDENSYVLYKPTDAQYLKLVSDTLNAYYPGSKQAISLSQNLAAELNTLNAQKLSELVKDVEGVDLDLDLESINGNRIKLSSLKGKKVVLLSFWSALSNECISNNLQLMEYYRRYKNKGFEIYHVNLDVDEDAWRRAVKYDGFPWISVREDDPANPVNVVKYNVTKVPSNYLIDRDGDIIGKDLFGKPLQIRLNQLFE